MNVLLEVLTEVDKAKEKFPQWPTDPLHAVAVLGEEFGELTQAILQRTYENPASIEHVREEAIQTAAMAIRFLEELDNYKYTPSYKIPTVTDNPYTASGGPKFHSGSKPEVCKGSLTNLK